MRLLSVHFCHVCSGWFGGSVASLLEQTSAHPADNDVIVIFVVGGITGCELEQASAVLADLLARAGPTSKDGRALQSKTVYIGSTQWLSAGTAATAFAANVR
jgi:hypothetical protein